MQILLETFKYADLTAY